MEQKRREHEASIKNYCDYYSTMKTAMKKGREEERMKNARSLKANGVPLDVIARSLNLTVEEISQL